MTSTPETDRYLADRLREAGPERSGLFILLYGVDRFEKEIARFSKESGVAESYFQEIVDDVRLASDPNAPRVKEQHLVSEVLLREWCTRRASGHWRMGYYSTAFGIRPDTSPQSVAKIDDFVQIDSQTTEEVWGQVETNIPGAIAAAEAGTLFNIPEHVATIKNTIALHYARSIAVKEGSEANVQSVVEGNRAALRADQPKVDLLFRLKTGENAAPTDADREEIVKEMSSGVVDLAESGMMFRFSVIYLFKAARALLDGSDLELSRAPAGSEFLIGDVPVVTVDESGNYRGVVDGLPIGNARAVGMPLSPTIVVCMAKANTDQVATAEQVERLNRWQIDAARRSVFTTSGSPLLAGIATVRPPTRPPTGSQS